MNAIKIKKPKVKVSAAIEFAGNQANLARILGIKRSSVNEWLSDKREYVPELQAFKLISVNPDLEINT